MEEPRPRRSITLIRTSTSTKADRADPAPDGPSQTTDFANKRSPAAGGAAPAGKAQVGSSGSYFTSKLEAYNTADFVPPNAYASATVLVGVDSAASVNSASDPKPVLFRITGDAVSVGANGRYQHTSLKGCMVNGAAYGELSSEKVYVKLQRITCPAGDKKFSVATVEGYVTQRGKAGVRGFVVERAGGSPPARPSPARSRAWARPSPKTSTVRSAGSTRSPAREASSAPRNSPAASWRRAPWAAG